MVDQSRGMSKERQLKWTSVNVQEVIDSDYRLDVIIYGIEGRQARQNLAQCKWDVAHLGDKFIEAAFYLGRFKRTKVWTIL